MPLEIPITQVITKTIVLSDDVKDYEFYGRRETGNAFEGECDFYVARHLETGYWRFFRVDGTFKPNEFRIPNYFDLNFARWLRVKVIPPQKDWKFEVIDGGPNV